MRVALLLPGEPRFCSEFDLFLENLRGYDQVDWFVWLWKDSRSEEHRGVDLVAPSWQHLEHQTTHDRLVSYLPPGHQLTKLSIVDKSQHPSAPQVVHRKAGETSVERMWGMYTSIRECDLLRRAQEQAQGQNYDLVIRSRPDLGLVQPLDLAACWEYLQKNPQTVITPSNEVHGYGHKTNDMMAIGLSSAMTTYCDLVQHIVEYHHRLKLIYHPETMLAFHMAEQGLTNHNKGSHEVAFRRLGTVDGKVYRSNYGRWA
jgi:hypothetical protein